MRFGTEAMVLLCGGERCAGVFAKCDFVVAFSSDIEVISWRLDWWSEVRNRALTSAVRGGRRFLRLN